MKVDFISFLLFVAFVSIVSAAVKESTRKYSYSSIIQACPDFFNDNVYTNNNTAKDWQKEHPICDPDQVLTKEEKYNLSRSIHYYDEESSADFSVILLNDFAFDIDGLHENDMLDTTNTGITEKIESNADSISEKLADMLRIKRNGEDESLLILIGIEDGEAEYDRIAISVSKGVVDANSIKYYFVWNSGWVNYTAAIEDLFREYVFQNEMQQKNDYLYDYTSSMSYIDDCDSFTDAIFTAFFMTWMAAAVISLTIRILRRIRLCCSAVMNCLSCLCCPCCPASHSTTNTSGNQRSNTSTANVRILRYQSRFAPNPSHPTTAKTDNPFECHECIICMEPYASFQKRIGSDNQPLKIFSCGHSLDQECWREYQQKNPESRDNCPVCRQRVNSSSSTFAPSSLPYENDPVPSTRSNGLNIYVELDSDEEVAILVHSRDDNYYLENEMLTSSSNLRIARSHPSYGSTIDRHSSA